MLWNVVLALKDTKTQTPIVGLDGRPCRFTEYSYAERTAYDYNISFKEMLLEKNAEFLAVKEN